MIGTVLTTTVKTVLVGTFVRVRQLVVEPIVRVITIVFIIVSKCGHHGHLFSSFPIFAATGLPHSNHDQELYAFPCLLATLLSLVLNALLCDLRPNFPA